MKIEIENINDQLLHALLGHGFTAPNACFQNCFCTVAVFGEAAPGGMTYVLCWLIDEFYQRHPHALVGIGGKYFDITLQANPKAIGYVREYLLERSLSRADAIRMFADAGGRIEKIGASTEVEGVAPALFSDGSIRCQAITSL